MRLWTIVFKSRINFVVAIASADSAASLCWFSDGYQRLSIFRGLCEMGIIPLSSFYGMTLIPLEGFIHEVSRPAPDIILAGGLR